MDSFTSIQEITRKPIVPGGHSVANGNEYYEGTPKRPKMSRMTSVTRTSIAENAPATLSFHNINYSVRARADSIIPFCRSQEAKQILFNVSGQFTNGMNAILGKISFLLKLY